SIKDTKSRWGSCSSNGNLSFCWKLVLAPEEVFKYVIAHEVSHLKHMNHSPEFWKQVQSLMPNYKTHCKWLKLNGHNLHLYNYEI
ncbi:M48 family metallopeptidase, partial [Rickettsiales bacterium]|nr:M48 family metallopeptidase [Rickettsiales bacterium]